MTVVQAPIHVESSDDWSKLRELQATDVLDPTIIRVGQLFLQGASAAPDGTWPTLLANLRSLAAFVDALILSERVPVFDFGPTWDALQGPVRGDGLPKGLDVCSEEGLYSTLLEVCVHFHEKGSSRNCLRPTASPAGSRPSITTVL